MQSGRITGGGEQAGSQSMGRWSPISCSRAETRDRDRGPWLAIHGPRNAGGASGNLGCRRIVAYRKAQHAICPLARRYSFAARVRHPPSGGISKAYPGSQLRQQKCPRSTYERRARLGWGWVVEKKGCLQHLAVTGTSFHLQSSQLHQAGCLLPTCLLCHVTGGKTTMAAGSKQGSNHRPVGSTGSEKHHDPTTNRDTPEGSLEADPRLESIAHAHSLVGT